MHSRWDGSRCRWISRCVPRTIPPVAEWLPDHRECHPSIELDQGLLRERIEEVLQGLSWREREIIKLRYGLGDGHCYTLDEVGKIFAVTRERIRQIEHRAMRKLQDPLAARKLTGFLENADLFESVRRRRRPGAGAGPRAIDRRSGACNRYSI